MIKNGSNDNYQNNEKYAKISKNKPIQFYNHLHKSLIKKNQLPSYFIFYQ